MGEPPDRKRKAKLCIPQMADRLSMLPSNAISSILLGLPIRDAIRTSLLSRKWRYEWTSIPELVFDVRSFPESLYDKIGEIVSQVLLLHDGPICKFDFDGYIFRECFGLVDRWLVYLARNGIKELILSFSPHRRYQLPTSLFNSRTLTYLELQDCVFVHPCVSEGFPSLRTLVLTYVAISDDSFARLISNCPLLRILKFFYFDGCSCVKVNAPVLRELVVKGFFHDLFLENTPLLDTLRVGLRAYLYDDIGEPDNEAYEDLKLDKFNNALTGIVNIERMELRSNILELMAKDSTLGMLPTYQRLKRLHLGFINFRDVRYNRVICCFLQHSPMLQELVIEAHPIQNIAAVVPAAGFWEEKESADSMLLFINLQTVTVLQISGNESEMEFIRFVLAYAPMLRTFDINLASGMLIDEEFFEEFIQQLPRASTEAEISVF